MHDFLTIDAAFVTAQIGHMKLAYPDLADDAELLAGMIEGETDFERVMARIVDEFLDAISMKGAVADRMSDLRVRGDRFDRKGEALKTLALTLMQVSGQTTLRLPEATLSLRDGYRSVVIDDETQIPQGFKRVEITPLKTEIKKALENNPADVPGAHLETGPATLSVRTK